MNNLINIDESSQLSKIELQERGAKDSQDLLDAGYTSPLDMVAQGRKAIEYLTAFVRGFDSAAREQVANNGGESIVLGSIFTLGSTGERLDYDQDPIYAQLKKDLRDREFLLKTAKNAREDIYGGDASQVPRLPLKSASKEILKVRL